METAAQVERRRNYKTDEQKRNFRRREAKRFQAYDQAALSARLLARQRMTRMERIRQDVAAGIRPSWPAICRGGELVYVGRKKD